MQTSSQIVPGLYTSFKDTLLELYIIKSFCNHKTHARLISLKVQLTINRAIRQSGFSDYAVANVSPFSEQRLVVRKRFKKYKNYKIVKWSVSRKVFINLLLTSVKHCSFLQLLKT